MQTIETKDYYRREWASVLQVGKPEELPLKMLSECINQSILSGADRIEVSFSQEEGFTVKDNSFGLNSWKKGDNLMEMVFPNPPGMADDGNALISRVAAYQWGGGYALVNCLSSMFRITSCRKKQLYVVSCKDGVLHDSENGDLPGAYGRIVRFLPFKFIETVNRPLVEKLLVAIGRLFPDISLSFCEFPPRQFKKISK